MRDSPPQSGYNDVDHSGDPWRYVRRLDELRASEFWSSLKTETFRLLAPRPGDSVLDVGCGTGEEVVSLAQLVGPTGRVVGIDSSATMIGEARRRAEHSLCPVEFFVSDAQRMDLPDDSFDACRAERVLQHVEDPQRVIGEMTRVGRAGSRVVVAEPDYGTLVIEGGEQGLTRRIIEARRAHFRHATIGRKLPGLFRDAGLRELTVQFVTLTSNELAMDAQAGHPMKYAALARARGAISVDEGASWLADLHNAAQVGRYRHAVTLFVVSGRKPQVHSTPAQPSVNAFQSGAK